MKKWFERMKDAWYRILPLLLLFGLPTAIAIVIGVIRNWDNIPTAISSITNLGSGSLVYGLFFLFFGLIGAVNAFAALMMWLNAFLDLLSKKVKSLFGFWFVIIIVTFGWYALFEILKKMP